MRIFARCAWLTAIAMAGFFAILLGQDGIDTLVEALYGLGPTSEGLAIGSWLVLGLIEIAVAMSATVAAAFFSVQLQTEW